MNQTKLPICGFDAVEQEVLKIKTHKGTYTIFEVSQNDPVTLRVVYSDGMDTSDDLRFIPAEDELQKIFESCKARISPERSYFIVYDFGYYNEKNNYRSMMILVSYIPESVSLRSKITMSSNTAVILSALQIPMHIEAHEIADFSYRRLKADCSSIQRK